MPGTNNTNDYEITGAKIKHDVPSDKYKSGWDRIFGSKPNDKHSYAFICWHCIFPKSVFFIQHGPFTLQMSQVDPVPPKVPPAIQVSQVEPTP